MASGLSTGQERPVFIVNRNAGRFRRDPRLLDRVARAAGNRADVFATRSAEEVEEAARRAVRDPHAPVVLCGGDGTYLAGVTALVRAAGGGALPPVVLARGGTVSIVARNWGGPGNLVETARRVCERPESLRLTTRPTLSVEEEEGAARVGFTFGTGLVARFFEEYERAGAGGNWAAFRIAVRAFAHSLTGGPYAGRILAPLPCRLTANQRKLAPSEWSLVVCSVLRDVGLHILVTYRAAEDPARPHLVASPLPPRSLGPQWPRVVLGKRLVGDGNFDGLVDDFTITFPGERGPYVLDGDMFRSKRVTVRAGPVLRVLT